MSYRDARNSPESWPAVVLIARQEWKQFIRTRAAWIAALIVLVIALTSVFTSFQQWHQVTQTQRIFGERNQHEFESQPDRHPHRMAHYGQYLFREPGPLAFFDFGVDDFAGRMIYLEAHRENSANFSNASQSSSLIRFGQLTPAGVLQLLYPLLIIFLGFNCISRERESNTLRLLLSQRISGLTLISGKLLGQATIILALAAPLLVAPPLMTLALGLDKSTAVSASTAALLSMCYAIYLLIWSAVTVSLSALIGRSRDVLVTLLACWMFASIAIPRVGAQIASRTEPVATRFETAIRIHEDLQKIGDSHNPNDPYYAKFKADVLARYGVERVEDLPIDYGGLLLSEGERQSSALFKHYANIDSNIQARQLSWLYRFGMLTPLLPLRQLSMSIAGTDTHAVRDFSFAAEQHRYGFVQALNQLQVEHVRHKGDRIASSHWADMPHFMYQAPGPAMTRLREPLFMLSAWLFAAAALINWSGKVLVRKVMS